MPRCYHRHPAIPFHISSGLVRRPVDALEASRGISAPSDPQTTSSDAPMSPETAKRVLIAACSLSLITVMVGFALEAFGQRGLGFALFCAGLTIMATAIIRHPAPKLEN